MTTYWTLRRNASTRLRILRALGAFVALAALSAPALAAGKGADKPAVCASFEVMTSESGSKAVVCYDSKRPYIFRLATIVTIDGRKFAVGYR